MGNPNRGDVTFDAGGKTYTLRYSANAICELEDALDKGVVALTVEMANWEKNPALIRFSTIRAVFWAGLRDHHQGISVTEAGDLVLVAGGIEPVMNLVGQAFALAFPNAETKGARPPKRGASGTSQRS